jgi:L-Ala-D/L-Glu epimerase
MVIERLTLTPLEIPFRTGFKHHSAERKSTQAVIASAHSRSGSWGLGEGCPREYVTGENVATCLAFFSAHREEWMGFSGLADLIQWTENRAALIDANPAAWCAVELALLGVFAKDAALSVEALLGLPELQGDFAYTAVLGDGPIDTFRAQLQRYLGLGMRDFKVKLSGDLAADAAKVTAIQAANAGERFRLDGNNLWSETSEAVAFLQSLPALPFALEEPLRPFDFSGMTEIVACLPVKIILDESVLRFEHLSAIPKSDARFIVNLRVSKMGGLIRSLGLAREARRLGLPLIIGAQVGETSLLTRCALSVANAFSDIVLAREGAFGTLLLERDIVAKPLVFGKQGILRPGDFLQLEACGFQMAYLNPGAPRFPTDAAPL